MEPAGGFAAQATAGAVDLRLDASTATRSRRRTSISGAVIGSGATKRLSAVRWGVAGQHRRRLGPDDPGRGRSSRRRCYCAGRGDLLGCAFGLGPGSERDLRAARAGRGQNARRHRARGRAALPRVPVVVGHAGGRQGPRARGRPARLRADPLDQRAVRDAVRPRRPRRARVRGRRRARTRSRTPPSCSGSTTSSSRRGSRSSCAACLVARDRASSQRCSAA